MWSPCLTNDYQPILAASLGRQGWTFAFLEGTNLGRSAEEVPVLQEKTEISVCRALLWCPCRACPRTLTVELSRTESV
eukprot:scaffold53405_cov78-Phaeocystis_antarctica.AAC.1